MADYYVTKAGSNANDGSQGSPWLTITYALSQVGSTSNNTIWVGDGTWMEQLSFPARTAATGYLTVRAVNPRSCTLGAYVSTGNILFGSTAGTRLVKVQGFDLAGPLGIEHTNGSTLTSMVFEDIVLKSTCTRGVRMYGPGSDWTFKSVHHQGCGYGMILGNEAWTASYTGYEGASINVLSNVLIEDCTSIDCVAHPQSDGFVVEGNVYPITFRRCLSHGQHDAGFDVKSPTLYMESCSATGNGSNGYKIWGCEDVHLYNCLAYADNKWGFSMVNNNQILEHCTSFGNTEFAALAQGPNPSTQTFTDCIFVGGLRNFYNQTYKIVPVRCLFFPDPDSAFPTVLYQSANQGTITYAQWLANPAIWPTTNCAYGDPDLGPTYLPSADSPAMTMSATGNQIGYLGTAWNAIFNIAAQSHADGSASWTDDTVLAMLLDSSYTLDVTHTTLEDIPAWARLTTGIAVPNRSIPDGVFCHGELVWQDVTNADAISAILYYRDGNTEADTMLWLYINSAWGLPIDPNGSDVHFVPDDERLVRL